MVAPLPSARGAICIRVNQESMNVGFPTKHPSVWKITGKIPEHALPEKKYLNDINHLRSEILNHDEARRKRSSWRRKCTPG
jgi:hypothetical protein